jgi:hypothetical protein
MPAINESVLWYWVGHYCNYILQAETTCYKSERMNTK